MNKKIRLLFVTVATLLALASFNAGANEKIYFYHADHLGTPQVVTDQNQTVVWEADYQPFGGVAVRTESIKNNVRFPGQYYDHESILTYNYFRDYDPSTGRYMSSDPIGLAGGINTYAYVGNNPLYWVDPLGLDVQLCKAPAQIAGGLVDHHWIKTDTKEAGMGGDVANAGDQYESLYVTKVFVRDHSGQSETRPGASCETVPNVDEDMVNQLLEIDKPLGRFSAFNNCQTFAGSVLDKSKIPQVPVDIPPDFRFAP